MNLNGDDKQLPSGDGEPPKAASPSPPPAEIGPEQPRGEGLSAPNLNWPSTLPVIDVADLDWSAVEKALSRNYLLSRMPRIASDFQQLLEREAGCGMLFDLDRSDLQDKAIQVTKVDAEYPLWFIGDLHGDLLALEAALLLIRQHAIHGSKNARIVFLGDLFDDQGYGLEILLRVFELATESPKLICVLAGNHDEALGHDGVRFTSIVEPSDFSQFS